MLGFLMVDGATLQKILQEEADILNRMVELEGETQAVLVRGDAAELDKLNSRKEELIKGLAALEEQRKQVFSEETTLEEYLITKEPQNRLELTEIKRIIINLHASLQKRLEINRYLLYHNLQFARNAMNAIFPDMNDTVYASRGERMEQTGISSGLLDLNA